MERIIHQSVQISDFGKQKRRVPVRKRWEREPREAEGMLSLVWITDAL